MRLYIHGGTLPHCHQERGPRWRVLFCKNREHDRALFCNAGKLAVELSLSVRMSVLSHEGAG